MSPNCQEIFLMDFAQRAYDQSSGDEIRSDTLEYDDIHKLVHSDSRYDFLADTIPKKIKFSEALKMVEESNRAREAEMKRRKEIQGAKLKADLERKQKEAEEIENQANHKENVEDKTQSNQTHTEADGEELREESAMHADDESQADGEDEGAGSSQDDQ